MDVTDNLTEIGTYDWAKRTGGRVNQAQRQAIQKAMVASQLQQAARVSAELSHRARHLDMDTIKLPDSPIVKQTAEHSESLYPGYLLNHCYRTFYWGHLLARLDGVQIEDDEAYCVAALLHDLGCVEAHHHRQPRVHCFAVEGGFAAEAFLTARGFPAARAQRVAEAIILHTNAWGVGEKHGAVAQYLYAGAACDVVGERAAEIPPAQAQAVLRRCPAEDAHKSFGEFLAGEVATRPDSRIAVAMTAAAEGRAPELFPWQAVERGS